jgi:AMMECR1 domain-containing protein
MAGAAAGSDSLAIKDPEQIVIDKVHVHYANALLREHFKPADTRRDPVFNFEDSRCPSMYRVYIIYDKRRPRGAHPIRNPIYITATSWARACRGIGFGHSKGLAQAIRMAAENMDPLFAAIDREELYDLRCTVILLRQFQRVVDPDTWQRANHGLVLREENPDYDPQHEDSLQYHYHPHIYLKEVAKSQRWSFNQTLSSLLDEAGHPSDPESCAKAVSEGRVYYFEASSAALPAKCPDPP